MKFKKSIATGLAVLLVSLGSAQALRTNGDLVKVYRSISMNQSHNADNQLSHLDEERLLMAGNRDMRCPIATIHGLTCCCTTCCCLPLYCLLAVLCCPLSIVYLLIAACTSNRRPETIPDEEQQRLIEDMENLTQGEEQQRLIEDLTNSTNITEISIILSLMNSEVRESLTSSSASRSSDSALKDFENQEIFIPGELRTHEVSRVILDSETPEECVGRLLGLTQETKKEFLRRLLNYYQKERSEQ